MNIRTALSNNLQASRNKMHMRVKKSWNHNLPFKIQHLSSMTYQILYSFELGMRGKEILLPIYNMLESAQNYNKIIISHVKR